MPPDASARQPTAIKTVYSRGHFAVQATANAPLPGPAPSRPGSDPSILKTASHTCHTARANSGTTAL